MSDVIIVKPEKCTGCNACVRVCPAPEANITRMLDNNKFITTVNSDKCIACGECVKTCQHGARDYIDDTDACMTHLEEKREKLIVLVTPSIKTALPDKWKGVLDWFKQNGCIIFDVSYGADICTWAHLKAIEHGKLGNTITQPCAAVVNYIQKYQPKLLQSLSPIHSPLCCEAVYVKKYERRSNPIVALTPCVAKKVEFEETELIDYNVTFRKLMEYFEKNYILIANHDPSDFSYEFEGMQGQMGSVYPRPGGLKDNMLMRNPELNIVNSEGVHKVYPELDMYAQLAENKRPDVFDVLSCEYGCNSGPASSTKLTSFDMLACMRAVEKDVKSKYKTKGIMRTTIDDKLFKKFDEELDFSDFIRSYKPATPSSAPTDNDLEPIFESMGKHTEADRNYNCHACGYASCRAMATAIYRGLNTPSNCTIHAKEILLARHSELAEQHERLSEITNECITLSEQINRDIKDITDNMAAINDSTQKTSKRAAVVNDLLKNVVLFCNSNSTMNAETVGQLIKILETTIEAFSALDDNVSTTNSSSAVISEAIDKINELIQELDNTLHRIRE
ncbi:MAG: 4Fe-4S binding protein [Oscillospiraceae bacterium]|nr:4Fe-4S binding protein [Oscillospiraceae bacterium]